MEKDWVMIFSTDQPYQAELAKQILEENRITPVVMNKRDSSYNTFGEFEVYVARKDVVRGKYLLKNLES